MGYSQERKEAALKLLLPPESRAVRPVSDETGIGEATLYKWRNQARGQGRLAPGAEAGPEGWSSGDKFAAVLETAALNAADLSKYCRTRGLYPEQIAAWRDACEQANDWDKTSSTKLTQATKEDRKLVKDLQRELARKEKALAEAAALLVLRKKMNAIWGREDE